MGPRLPVQQRRAQHGLQRQLFGDVPGQSDVHASVYQRLYEQEGVGRSPSAEGGGHVQVFLVFYVDLLAQGLQHLRPRLPRLGARSVGGGPHGDPAPYLGGGVGHCPDQNVVAQSRAKGVELDPRGYGDHHLPGPDAAIQLLQHVGHDLGLNRQHHRLGAVQGREVVVHGSDAVGLGQGVASRLQGFADEDVGSLRHPPFYDAADYGLRHDPAADERQFYIGPP